MDDHSSSTLLPNIFEDCLKQQCDDQDSNFLVIYEHNLLGSYNHIQAYLLTTQRIVDKFQLATAGSEDDLLVIPLLNMYFNIIEFTLKYTIKKIIAHKNKTNCSFLRLPNKPGNEIDNILNSHNLNKLFDLLIEIIPKVAIIHSTPSANEIGTFIRKIVEFGIQSDSTRYLEHKKNGVYPLYKKQTYIYPLKIQKSIEAIAENILNLVESGEFDLCDCGEFTKKRSNELTLSLELLNKHCNLFIGRKSITFREDLEKLEKNELVGIITALYLAKKPQVQVENFDFFANWPNDQLISKISEKRHVFKDALIKTEIAVNYVNRVLSFVQNK